MFLLLFFCSIESHLEEVAKQKKILLKSERGDLKFPGRKWSWTRFAFVSFCFLVRRESADAAGLQFAAN